MDTAVASLDHIAEQYVRLVLSVGYHDPDYVDAYYGPTAWKQEVDNERPALDVIKERAKGAIAATETEDVRSSDPMLTLRRHYLRRQLQALVARTNFLSGIRMSFDEESQALYDAKAPDFTAEHFERLVRSLGDVLPGSGPVPERYERFKAGFVIPKEKLDRVFNAAIDEGRRRTREHIALPAGESFTIEYVTGKSWSGYNWYKGDSHSLIQVNTDLPIYIDRAVDLACHEGYPGHHVYNSLLEQHLVRQRGWVEFTAYALFSPQSLIAEGTANYGIEMALPGSERVAFERETLFPLAGLDPAHAEQYYRAHTLFQRLGYAGNEAARRYLNGEITREEAVDWLVRYALMPPERAQQRTRFFDQYRSYVINYNLGQDLVKKYIEAKGGIPERPKQRWKIFSELLSSPRLPSGLR